MAERELLLGRDVGGATLADRVLWTLVGVFALFNLAKPLLGGTPMAPLVPALSVFVPIAFVLIHAPRLIGWKRLALFFGLTFAICGRTNRCRS